MFSKFSSPTKDGETISFIPKKNIEKFIVDKLDLSIFRNSFGPARYPGMRFFKDFGMEPSKIQDGVIKFEESDWYYEIKILKRGDVNRDGVEDVVIQFTDDALLGSYLTSNTYLLTRYSKDGNLIAIAYEP